MLSHARKKTREWSRPKRKPKGQGKERDGRKSMIEVRERGTFREGGKAYKIRVLFRT